MEINARIVNLVVDSPEWHAHRAQHFNASEAPVMMNVSSYKTRGELLRVIAGGKEEEITAFQKIIFERGHKYEAAARPIAEEILGEDLFVQVWAGEVDGIPMSASLDGITMVEDTIFEHKSMNAEIEAAMDRGEILLEHRVQMEQQLMLSGAQRALFMASNGTKESAKWAFYEPDLELRRQIVAGWKQFREDVANYQHVEVLPAPEADPISTLPVLAVEVTGQVVNSNLDLYRSRALEFISGINTDLKTDQDFANAEKTVKFCDEAEKRIELVKQQALAQTLSIDSLFSTLDELREQMRAKRLTLSKLVTARKDAIRAEIIQGGKDAFADHIRALNKRLGRNLMPDIPADFVGAVKSKKTVQSLRDAVDGELARAKIAANEVADRIQINLTALNALKPEHQRLFTDAAKVLQQKSPEDFAVLLQLRVREHEEAEAKRLEAERERIRAEEAERLRREAAEAERLRLMAEARERAAAEAARAEEERQRIAREAEEKMATSATATHETTLAPAMTIDSARIVAAKISDVRPAATVVVREIVERENADRAQALQTIRALGPDGWDTLSTVALKTIALVIEEDMAEMAPDEKAVA